MIIKKITISLLFIFYLTLPANDEICQDCHGMKDFVVTKNGKRISLYVNHNKYKASIHADLGCTACHTDIDENEIPHSENHKKVNCQICHKEATEEFNKSLHGIALKNKKYLAPTCASCHTKHEILSSSDENSSTYVMNIPALCGSCHKEGTQVSKLAYISQHHILEDYSESIHGDGLFRRGLTVTAVCTSCHNSHNILPHEDPESSISRSNIPKTCMQCHAQIEKVHTKIISGELWEKKPNQIPVCVDCHPPHKVRRVFYEDKFPDRSCMQCHSKQIKAKNTDGTERLLFVDTEELNHSIHANIACVKCHVNVNPNKNPICIGSGKVNCEMCHSEEVENYKMSTHGKLHWEKNPDAPYCSDCHGTHNTKSKKNNLSSTFAKNIPQLCGECHKDGGKAAVKYAGEQKSILKHYTQSIHGKGLLESGLTVTATCVSCHTAHSQLPISDLASSVHPKNISNTCAECHLGVYNEFSKSIHSPLVSETKDELPVCSDCHFAHSIENVDMSDFRQSILKQCGDCHKELTESYFQTFHGKVSNLGSEKTAKCHDCHGSHNILPVSNPESTLSFQNVVNTCKNCHPNSNRKFVGYLTHATHHDKEKYPILYYTYLFMSILLTGTFIFFGLHTIFWLPRALAEKRNRGISNE